MQEVWVVRAGVVPYTVAREAQGAIEQARHAGDVPDVLLLLEHPPVYTRGRRSLPEELPMGEEWYRTQGIEVCETNRGGRVTYHGPGQLVGYPIIGLREYDDGVHGFVRRLEQVMSGALSERGIETQVFDGLTGVWTAGAPPISVGTIGPQGSPVRSRSGASQGPGDAALARKIGAIGVHVRRAITTHGFAINVSNDLRPFEWIVPCGIEACRATSVTLERGAEESVDRFGQAVAVEYATAFERQPAFMSPQDLGLPTEILEQLVPAPVSSGQ